MEQVDVDMTQLASLCWQHWVAAHRGVQCMTYNGHKQQQHKTVVGSHDACTCQVAASAHAYACNVILRHAALLLHEVIIKIALQ